ncbi:hypothetical protein ATW97_07850 [Oenococcus oeni]|uniref:membrane protein n=4 Tax=Oenococcus oeni TaxID=1247 RepID=UPI00050FC653|nr:membrane protein [Oenococcus oeni]KGH59764.1 membrane protein [Oenococcus oeni IOEB_9805]KGH62366.1 membrane protein [Oenococcus oeni S13]KGH72966.1 membrane protein [Oenococcus oeni IOEB_0502]KGH75131.1 membrane protein [Oenococcus oeni IOEB_9803]KGH77328.1 membrane protein [Oenococcus oeni IOEB_8417]
MAIKNIKENELQRESEFEKRMIVFSFLVMYLLAAFFISSVMDVRRFNIPWALEIPKNCFNIYSSKIHPLVNYPPLIPLILGVIGSFLNFVHISLGLRGLPFYFLCNGLVKLPSLIGTFAFITWLKKERSSFNGNNWPLVLLLLCSPALFFNTAVWGQFDVINVITLFLSFYYLENKHVKLASFWMAVSLLSKLQAVYFFPIFVLFLIIHYKFLDYLKSFITGSLTFLVPWFPLMIINHDFFLPIKLYLNGSGRYLAINDHAFNFWSVFYPYSVKLLPKVNNVYAFGLTFKNLNFLILLIILAIIFLMILRFHFDLNEALLMYSLWIFTFTMQQHERYEIPSLAFILLILILKKDRQGNLAYLLIFGALNILIFFNQLNVYLSHAAEISFGNIFVLITSIISVCLTIAISVYLVFKDKLETN